MDKPRTYEPEYKKEAVILAKEIGAKKASEELKIPRMEIQPHYQSS